MKSLNIRTNISNINDKRCFLLYELKKRIPHVRKQKRKFKKVEDKDLKEVAGGINNIDKLKSYIYKEKRKGKTIDEIMRVVVCMPDNLMYLDVTYDETGRPVSAEGVEELMNFTREYYDSLVIPEE